MPITLDRRQRETWTAGGVRLLTVGVSTLLMLHLATTLLPTSAGLMGHDYSYFLPYLVSGANWIRLHGWLAPPYFTPDFCGGMPWLANPQSLFYSAPQLLASYLEPVAAVRWTLIAFSCIGAIATYHLLRTCFRTSSEAAVVGFALFQLNSFLTFRMAVGHLTFHAFGLVPVLAVLVLSPVAPTQRRWPSIVVRVASGGGIIAVMVFAGALNLLMPIFLSIAAIVLIAQLSTGWQWRPWIIFGASIAWSIPLSAIKLVPAFVLAMKFPRSQVPTLFTDVSHYLVTLGRALFFPDTLPILTALNPHGVALGQFELEFGVSLVPALLLLGVGVAWCAHPRRPRHPFILLGLASIAVAISAVTFGSHHWAEILQRMPVINNNTVLTRWWIVYLIALIVAGSLAFDRIAAITARPTTLLACCAVVVFAFAGSRHLERYATGAAYPMYDPAPARLAAANIDRGVPLPPVTEVVHPVARQAPDATRRWAQNDGAFAGETAVPCYEALFDRGALAFRAKELIPGPVYPSTATDSINLADPRCYLNTAGSGCMPGARFGVSDTASARLFTTHRILPWQQPLWHRVSVVATVLSLILTGLTLSAAATVGIRSRSAPTA